MYRDSPFAGVPSTNTPNSTRTATARPAHGARWPGPGWRPGQERDYSPPGSPFGGPGPGKKLCRCREHGQSGRRRGGARRQPGPGDGPRAGPPRPAHLHGSHRRFARGQTRRLPGRIGSNRTARSWFVRYSSAGNPSRVPPISLACTWGRGPEPSSSAIRQTRRAAGASDRAYASSLTPRRAHSGRALPSGAAVRRRRWPRRV